MQIRDTFRSELPSCVYFIRILHSVLLGQTVLLHDIGRLSRRSDPVFCCAAASLRRSRFSVPVRSPRPRGQGQTSPMSGPSREGTGSFSASRYQTEYSQSKAPWRGPSGRCGWLSRACPGGGPCLPSYVFSIAQRVSNVEYLFSILKNRQWAFLERGERDGMTLDSAPRCPLEPSLKPEWPGHGSRTGPFPGRPTPFWIESKMPIEHLSEYNISILHLLLSALECRRPEGAPAFYESSILCSKRKRGGKP